MANKKTFESKSFSLDREGKKLSFENGKLAVQADSTILVTFEETSLLCTVCMDQKADEDKDFLPLMLDFRESYSAAGRIAGAVYRRREWRPSDSAILYARLTDRTLRPMFPKGMINNTVISVTPLALDHNHELGAISIIWCSLAVMAAGIPFDGPVWACHLGYVDDKFVINPTNEELENSKFNLIVSGKKWMMNMIEADGDEVPKELMKEALKIAQEQIDKTCDAQSEFIKQLEITLKKVVLNKPSDSVLAYISNILTKEKLDAMAGPKAWFSTLFSQYEDEVLDICKDKITNEDEADFTKNKVKSWVFQTIKHFLRTRTIDDWIRIDDRDEMTIRDLYCETWLFKRTHGTGLFRRGNTQVLTTVTLGWPKDYIVFDDMEHDNVKQKYFHHYNFPPFSVGDARGMRGTGRRELGHGKLAEKAVIKMVESNEDFPYSIRLVSECLWSGGSTSMGATCGSTLALLDAWVPMKNPVWGIAMGMMSDHEEDGTITKYRILNDIMGTEDFTGDMDYKVAGTKNGITAIQLDTKVKGITLEIAQEVIDRAFDGYNEILDFMLQTISAPKEQMSQYAPKIIKIMVPITKIKDVIGKWGEVINKIIEESGGVKIDFEDDGSCFITDKDQEKIDKAIEMIKDITEDLEVGKIYEGVISRVENYGVFVDLPKKKSALCHVSKLGPTFIKDPSQAFKVWDKMNVKLLSVDEKGRLNVEKVA